MSMIVATSPTSSSTSPLLNTPSLPNPQEEDLQPLLNVVYDRAADLIGNRGNAFSKTRRNVTPITSDDCKKIVVVALIFFTISEQKVLEIIQNDRSGFFNLNYKLSTSRFMKITKCFGLEKIKKRTEIIYNSSSFFKAGMVKLYTGLYIKFKDQAILQGYFTNSRMHIELEQSGGTSEKCNQKNFKRKIDETDHSLKKQKSKN